jgi:hypothetical protein
VVSTVVCVSILIGIYHGTYDLLLLFVPVAVGIGMAVRGDLTSAAERIALVAQLLVVLHLQTVSTKVIPGFDTRLADTMNLLLMLTGLGCGLYSVVATRRRVVQTGRPLDILGHPAPTTPRD